MDNTRKMTITFNLDKGDTAMDDTVEVKVDPPPPRRFHWHGDNVVATYEGRPATVDIASPAADMSVDLEDGGSIDCMEVLALISLLDVGSVEVVDAGRSRKGVPSGLPVGTRSAQEFCRQFTRFSR